MHRLIPLPILLLLAGCTATPAPVTAPAPTETATAELPHDIHWVRSSAEYHADFLQSYALAGERLEELAEGREAGTWAVALDADETVISNSLYQKERFEAGSGYTPESWAAWAERREATALPGAREFLEKVHALGGKIAIVTNRRDPICPATRDNFRALDLPFDVMLCRTDEGRKEPRWQSVEDGTASDLPPLEILMWLGDNIHDFPGGEQDWRFATDEELEDFGRRFVVLPNPMYGSWTDNPPQ